MSNHASSKIHFLFEQKKEPNAGFAKELIAALGQHDIDDADIIVSIGGDGLLLRALRQATGKHVCGIIPPGTNSRGFWTNKSVATADELLSLLNSAKDYPIKPLKAQIVFEDGSSAIRHAYNEIALKAVHKPLTPALREEFHLSAIDVSVQSALLNLKVSFDDAVIGPRRIMGAGLIFATPFGSTAMNRDHGGPSADIREDIIILTGMAITDPIKGFNSINNNSRTIFDVEVESSDKRPVMLTFDSFGVEKNEDGSGIANVTVSAAEDQTAQLLLKENPRLRAYSALTPIA